MILISAVVCTFNRAQFLTGALDSLIQQTLNPESYEIVVVDNASTDETPDVLRVFKEKYPEHNMVLVFEPRQGAAYARNTGLEHARGKYMACLDDDAQASPGWLEHAVELFETVEPTPICVGGPIFPFYVAPKPAWFKDEYEIKTYGSEPLFLRRGKTFTGPNMVWNTEIARRLGGFPINLGPKGDYYRMGEETALFASAWRSLAEPSMYYSPKLSVRHLVTPYQMTVAYRLKWEFVFGQSFQKIYGAQSLGGRLLFLVKLAWAIVKVGSLALWRVRSYTCWQNWFVEEWGNVARKLGDLSGTLGLTILTRRREE